jgi:gluconolactonase
MTPSRVSLVPALLLPVLAWTQALGPDSQRQPGVPKGAVTKYSWSSKIFPGTVRDYWVYVPAQYKPEKPACVMVFQDGQGYVNEEGAWRTPVVFDNLIQKREMPVTIGIFINPGVMPAADPARQQNRYNRSYEYDGMSDRYARFLLEEILPEVGRQYKLSADPNDRAIAGLSSGAIAAFTAAWQRPAAFHRVLSFIGSYTNLRGGNVYPDLIRKTEPKPLRVFLQDGSNDLNLYAGSWWMANQTMASALDYAGYEVKFVQGAGGHDAKQGGEVFPDALRWLWKDYPKPVSKSKTHVGGERHYITEILDPDSEWELVSEGHKFTEGAAVDRDGNFYFCDIPTNQVFKVGQDGKPAVFRTNSGGASGLMFGSDGRLYAAQSSAKGVVAWSVDGSEAVLAEHVSPNDLAVTTAGGVYFTEPATRKVWYIDPKGGSLPVNEGAIAFANGVRLSPDESLLYVTDSFSRWVWSYQIQADGSLANAERFFHLELPDDVESGPLRAHGDGMTIDTEGYVYVATNLGIQICDQPGRVVGIINKPSTADPSNLVFAGPGLKTLYVTAGDKVWRRRLRRHGYFPWVPFKPPQPGL